MFQILEMLRERHEQYLLQILKIDKFGNYLVVEPLKLQCKALACSCLLIVLYMLVYETICLLAH